MRKLEELGNEEKSFFSVADLPRRHEKNAENRGAKVCLSFCRRNVEEISFRLGGWLKVVYGARSCGGPTRWSTVRLYQDYDPFAVCHAITSHAEYQKVLSSLLFPLKDLQRSFLRKGERRIYLFSSLLEFNCCHFPRAKFRRIANFEFLFLSEISNRSSSRVACQQKWKQRLCQFRADARKSRSPFAGRRSKRDISISRYSSQLL